MIFKRNLGFFHHAVSVFLLQKGAPGMLPFRDSFALIRTRGRQEGATTIAGCGTPVPTLEFRRFSIAWP